ncbi:MAG: hypothetical protein NC912_03780 [Candidatus Omnitrophica bacterium]|nr:hypothetical protein [Candidatus Omnitrophota bacterium]
MLRINHRAQVSLEISISFVAILLFLLGMLRIWFWVNNDLIERQRDYISTRRDLGRWPIHQTRKLSDNIVFRGRF